MRARRSEAQSHDLQHGRAHGAGANRGRDCGLGNAGTPGLLEPKARVTGIVCSRSSPAPAHECGVAVVQTGAAPAAGGTAEQNRTSVAAPIGGGVGKGKDKSPMPCRMMLRFPTGWSRT